MSSSELHRVSQEELITVNQWLERHLPHSWKIYGTSREILSGRWSGHVFYTLGWPEIRGVVEKPDLDSNDNPCPSFYRYLYPTCFYAPDPNVIEEILQRHADWSQPYSLMALDDTAALAALRIAKDKGVDHCADVRVVMMQAQPGDIAVRPIPEGYRFRRIEPELDVAFCASTWLLQTPGNEEYFKAVSSHLPNGCLVNSDNECVSCAFGTEYGNIGMLYTRPEHRRRGLAGALMSHLAQEYFQEGLPVVAWVDGDNEASMKMQESLGFKRVGVHHTIFCEPGDFKDKENNVICRIVKTLVSH